MSILKKIDELAKGVKTYLAAGTGVMVVAVLQSQGIDAVGLVDTVTELAKDAVVWVNTVCFGAVALARRAMPDKRGS